MHIHLQNVVQWSTTMPCFALFQEIALLLLIPNKCFLKSPQVLFRYFRNVWICQFTLYIQRSMIWNLKLCYCLYLTNIFNLKSSSSLQIFEKCLNLPIHNLYIITKKYDMKFEAFNVWLYVFKPIKQMTSLTRLTSILLAIVY